MSPLSSLRLRVPAATILALLISPAWAAPLTVTDFKWLVGVGNDTYSERSNGVFEVGEDVGLAFNVGGLATGRDGNASAHVKVSCLDPAGVAMVKPVEGDVPVTPNPAGVGDAHVDCTLPPFARAGNYKVVVRVSDNNSKAAPVEFTQAFTEKRSTPAAAYNRLQVAFFYFADKKGGPAMGSATYHPGQTAFARLGVGGLKFSGDSSNVALGIRLLGPDGQQLMAQPNLAGGNEPALYHPQEFYRAFTFNLPIPASAPPGTYTEIFTVTDNIAKSSIEYTGKFVVAQ